MPIRPVPSSPADSVPDEEGEFDLSQLSDPDEDEEEEEEEEVAAAPPPREPEPDPATTARRKGGRPRKVQDPKPVGVGATIREPKQFWKSRDIEVLWPEVIEKIREMKYTPWDVDIRVKRTEPVEMLIGQPFPGGTVMGGNGKAASTQIVDKITDEYHMASGTMGPATYKIEIFWRVNAKVLTWGTLRCQSPDAIMGMRRQQQLNQQGSANQWPSQPYYPPPPPQYPPPSYAGYGAPPGFGAPPGYGAPPQAPPPSGNSEDIRELHYLRGTLDEVMRAMREGRQPNIQPPPGPAAMPSVDDIARRVVEMLRPAGLGAPPAAAVPIPQSPMAATLESSVNSILTGALQGLMKKVSGTIDTAIRGEGVGVGQPNEAVAEVVPEDPKDGLPFDMIALDSKWPDGRPVYFPKKKEDGTIDWMGVLAGNPFLVEKMADSASGLVGSVTDVIKTMGRAAIPGAMAEVVQNIPRGAVQAGMGQSQAPPPQPSPPPAPTMTPHANGAASSPASGGGWPT